MWQKILFDGVDFNTSYKYLNKKKKKDIELKIGEMKLNVQFGYGLFFN